jgi:thioesterase domain-containing protein
LVAFGSDSTIWLKATLFLCSSYPRCCLSYYELAYLWGFDQPFYGLQPLGLDGEQSPFTRIEEMAAHYIEALRQVQPSGPYFLGGWSFGGLVAFEMAQQLLRAGHQVALLAIFDTLAPIPGNYLLLGIV